MEKRKREKREYIARREARATYNRVRSPRRQWLLGLSRTHVGDTKMKRKRERERKSRETDRGETEKERKRNRANATHVETGRHVSTSNARPCGCTRRPGGRRCANGVEGRTGSFLSLSLSLRLSTGKGTKAAAVTAVTAAATRRESLYIAGYARVLSSYRERTQPLLVATAASPLPSTS